MSSRDYLGALYSFDGHTGRWPRLWYRYLDRRLRGVPELQPLEPEERRAVLYECRRRLRSDQRVRRARALRLGSLLIGTLGGCLAGALVLEPLGAALAAGAVIATFIAVAGFVSPVVRALADPQFQACLGDVLAEREAESRAADA